MSVIYDFYYSRLFTTWTQPPAGHTLHSFIAVTGGKNKKIKKQQPFGSKRAPLTFICACLSVTVNFSSLCQRRWYFIQGPIKLLATQPAVDAPPAVVLPAALHELLMWCLSKWLSALPLFTLFQPLFLFFLHGTTFTILVFGWKGCSVQDCHFCYYGCLAVLLFCIYHLMSHNNFGWW